MAKTQLTWYGQSAYRIVTPSGKTLLIDPWITNPKNPNGDKDLAALDKVDAIFLTHGHSDHVGDMVAIGKKTGATLVAALDLATAVTKLLGYPAGQASMETTGLFGGRVPVLGGDVTATLVPAFHGGGISKEEDSAPVYACPPSGFILDIKDGPCIYDTGDTDVFSDMSLVGRFHKIDVMLACIGDHFTMGPERAALATKLVGPRIVIPQHYGTFPVLTGTPEAFETALKNEGCAAELRVMKIGDTITL
jgi:L-ascorbate metabolism protein UlaG (beta-lactamase superfamily)